MIDSCHVDSDGAQPEIPTKIEGSATIMSYCDQKLPLASAPTFGGYWNRQGDRNELVNWKRDERIKSDFSKQPERVPYVSFGISAASLPVHCEFHVEKCCFS